MDKKDKEIQDLKDKLAVYESSPLVEGYLGVLKQIETCNKDLLDNPAGLRDEVDDKAFTRYDKYILNIDAYYAKLEILRDKMNPKEVKEVDSKVLKSKTMAL